MNYDYIHFIFTMCKILQGGRRADSSLSREETKAQTKPQNTSVETNTDEQIGPLIPSDEPSWSGSNQNDRDRRPTGERELESDQPNQDGMKRNDSRRSAAIGLEEESKEKREEVLMEKPVQFKVRARGWSQKQTTFRGFCRQCGFKSINTLI